MALPLPLKTLTRPGGGDKRNGGGGVILTVRKCSDAASVGLVQHGEKRQEWQRIHSLLESE